MVPSSFQNMELLFSVKKMECPIIAKTESYEHVDVLNCFECT